MLRPWPQVLALAVVFGLCALPARGQAQTCVNLTVAAVYSGATFTPGIDDLGIHCDDCTATVSFPFPVMMYGVPFTSAVVSSNGNVQFTGASTQYEDESLPTGNMGTAVFPLWDDLDVGGTGDGVFTSTTGTAPARVFNIEWRAHYLGQPETTNFEVRFFENSRTFEFVYGTSGAYAGQTYTVGVQQVGSGLARYVGHPSGAYPAGTRIVFTETYTSSRGPYSGPFPSGVTDIGNHCDDCITPITLPFPISFYGQVYTTANVSSNGNLQFASANAEYVNDCLPVAGFGPTIFAHWDDLLTDGVGEGVFTNLTGAAPFRVFDVNWRAHYISGGGTVNFTLRFLEGLDTIELFFLTSSQHGAGATIGTQAGDDRYREEWCNTLNSANAGDIYIFSLPPMEVRSYGGYVPPCTTDIGNHCDDCTTTITLPFTVSLFGEDFTTATISSNGNVQFGSDLDGYTNSCLPAAPFGTTIFGYWDDLRTDTQGSGIYTTTFFGAAPNRAFGIEWRATSLATGAPVHFEVVLYERTPRCEIYYGTYPDEGSATAGAQHGAGPEVFQHFCNALGRLPVSIAYVCLGAPCEPTIADQPQSVLACPTADTTFSVTPGAPTTGGPFTYQWQWLPPGGDSFIDMNDGPNVLPGTPQEVFIASGTHTQVLEWEWEDAGEITRVDVQCAVTNACGGVVSATATVTLCKADFDCSGDLAVVDIFSFLNSWFAGAIGADIDGVNGLQVADIFAFLNAWFAGC